MEYEKIEEIAKELCPHYDNGNCYYEVTEVCECCCGCEFCWAVSQVLNAGYRKIPDGAVVLTREEYEKLKSLAKGHCEYCYLMDLPDFESERLVRDTTRKETAEKFAEKLFDFLDDYALFDKRFLERKIDEIAKEITEGKV